MYKIIIFLIIIPLVSFANEREIDIYCKREVSYSYINGIMNKIPDTALDSALLIRNKVTFNKSLDLAFNQSKGVLLDLKDAFFQKVEESKSLPNRLLSWTWAKTNLSNHSDNRVSIINSLNENSKNAQEHIVFSHSQGNLYANLACKSEDLNLKFHNIQIASPASRIECGEKNHYTTINSDEMYALVDATTRGKLNIEDDSPYSFFLKEIGLIFGSPVGRITNLEPPMKSNIVQSTRTIGSVLNEKSVDSKLFKTHMIDNYLSFTPSLKHIQDNYHQIYNKMKPDDVILTSKKTTVNCENIEKFIGKDIFESSFTVKGQKFLSSPFKTHRFHKTEIEGKYLFTETFLWWKGLLGLIFAIPMGLLMIRCLPLVFESMEETDKEEQELKDQGKY